MNSRLKSLLKQVKDNEATISMILGSLAVITAGSLLFQAASKDGESRVAQISPQAVSTSSAEISTDNPMPTLHDVVISEPLEESVIVDTIQNEADVVEATPEIPATPAPTAAIEISEDLELPVEEIESDSQALANLKDDIAEETTFTDSADLQADGETHQVLPGDTLWNIAKKTYGSGYYWTDISKFNELSNPGLLEIGQVLKLPSIELPVESDTNQFVIQEAFLEQLDEASYQVQPGDSLWSISLEAYGVGFGWVEIYGLNSEIVNDPNVIEVGMTLQIPHSQL